MKSQIAGRPVRQKDFSFEDLYLEISEAWEKRAKELQRRRWQEIRQQEVKDTKDGVRRFN